MFSYIYNHIIPYSYFKLKRTYYCFVNKEQCNNIDHKCLELQELALDAYNQYFKLSRNEKMFIEKITGFYIQDENSEPDKPFHIKEIFLSSLKPLSIIFNNKRLTIKSYVPEKKKNHVEYSHIPYTTDYAYIRFVDGEALTSYQRLSHTTQYYFLPNNENLKKLNSIIDNVIGQWLNLQASINLLRHLQGEMDYAYIERQGNLLWQYVMTVDSVDSDIAYRFFMTNLYLHSKECGCNLYQQKYDDVQYHYINFWNYQIIPKEFEILLPYGEPMFKWNNIIEKRKNMLEDIQREGDKIALYNRFQETVPHVKSNQKKKYKI